MPWPDFTELTFGYAFLREFETQYVHGGQFPKAPDFISQNDEATKGYDVEIAVNHALPIFIQFKRSYVLTRNTAKEIRDGHYSHPRVYRMHLHRRGAYRQHKALEVLERLGNLVFYVTSQIYLGSEFAAAFTDREIVSSAAAFFSPREIRLPNVTRDHHVSFKAEDAFGYVYSEEGHRFERHYPTGNNLARRLSDGWRPAADNREILAKSVNHLLSLVSKRSPLRRLIADRPIEIQASILAYFVLDAHLTFAKQPGKQIS
jgi:hypothetical protein